MNAPGGPSQLQGFAWDPGCALPGTGVCLFTLPASSSLSDAAVSTRSFSLSSGVISAASLLLLCRIMAGAFLCLLHHVRPSSCKVEQRETGHCLSMWPPQHSLHRSKVMLSPVWGISHLPSLPPCTGPPTLGKKIGTIQLELKS